MPIQLDAKLNAFRRSSRGFFVTLEIGPDCDWSELAAAPLGQAFGVAMVPYDAETGQASPGSGASAVTSTGQQRGQPGKPRQPWNELPRSQRAGIRCGDLTFQLWLSKRFPNAEGDAATVLRAACGVKSRTDLNESPEAAERFDRLDAQFMIDTGQMAEVR